MAMGRTQLKYLPRRRTRKHEQEQAAKHEQEVAMHECQKMIFFSKSNATCSILNGAKGPTFFL